MSGPQTKIAYYITAHGYGHGTRSCDIINAVLTAAPDVPVIVKTDLPSGFLSHRLPDTIDVRNGAFDVGLVQKDSIQVDLGASLDAVEKLYIREDVLIAQEADFITKENVGVVVSDIPAIPLAAAQRSGIPGIATSNFGWDWIYEDFVRTDPRWQTYVDKFRTVYQQTDLLLRQPFAEPMTSFPNQIDLPLLASSGTERRSDIAAATGADREMKWVLLSFTSLNLHPGALENLDRLTDCELFGVEPLTWPGSCVRTIARSTALFEDIMASMDVVVTKPGFGIVSECIANNKPIIYSERKNFREYAILVENIQRYCRHAFIPGTELYSGDLARALYEIDHAPAPAEQMPRHGAELAAAEILKRLHT